MILRKLSGPHGSQVYDSEQWTSEQSAEDYIDTFGYPHDSEASFHFDVVKVQELKDWLDEM